MRFKEFFMANEGFSIAKDLLDPTLMSQASVLVTVIMAGTEIAGGHDPYLDKACKAEVRRLSRIDTDSATLL